MSDTNNDNWESAVARLIESSNKLKTLLGENWIKKIIGREGVSKEAWEQYHIWDQSFRDIRSCMRPTTIVPGTEDEEDVEEWRDLGQKDSYPVLRYLEMARSSYERIVDDDLDAPECEEMLTYLLDFPFFKPDNWLKKEDDLKPLYIRGAEIPIWLLNRYKEAVYSYVYGFNNSAIAMCRSIVEGIINNKVGDKCGKHVSLNDKIEFFVKTVKDQKHKEAIIKLHKVRKFASDILHDIRISAGDGLVKETLEETREFIITLY